tara:strand:+ start:6564 stop:7112 length:549 start_codon:yes stop_codon:yes gene_type:complete
MRFELIECAVVILLPIFAALMVNNFGEEKTRANMKVVYYKFFMFCAILFISSQIPIVITESSRIEIAIRIIGNIIMAALIFEFFSLPSEDTHPDDVAVIHTLVLWLVTFIFLAMCCFVHYKDISDQTKGWQMHPIKDIFKITKKIYDDRAMPIKDVEKFPMCNLFTFVKKIPAPKELPKLDN